MGISLTENLSTTEDLSDFAEFTEKTLSLSSKDFAELKPPDQQPAAPSVAPAADPSFAFSDAKLHSPSKVQVTFADGTSWLFHSGWLIDSSRIQVRECFFTGKQLKNALGGKNPTPGGAFGGARREWGGGEGAGEGRTCRAGVSIRASYVGYVGGAGSARATFTSGGIRDPVAPAASPTLGKRNNNPHNLGSVNVFFPIPAPPYAPAPLPLD